MLIPKQIFNVSKLAARDTSRFAINGVHVKRTEDGKCAAVTTDGRRLIVARWSDEHLRPEFPVGGLGSVEPVEDFSTIVSCRQWDEAGKAIPKRVPKPILEHCLLDENSANGKIQMGSTDLENERRLGGDVVEGTFPKYADVIPDYTVGENAVEIGVNPAFMAEICKAVQAVATDEDSKGVRLVISTDPGRPMTVEGHTANGIEATAILMPVNLRGRGDREDKRETKLRAVSSLYGACEAFARAFHEHYKDLQNPQMRDAYSLALDALEKTGWKLDDADLDDLAAEVAEEAEEPAADVPSEPDDVPDKAEATDPVEAAGTPVADDPAPLEPKRVSVRLLRDKEKAEKVAPVSGGRCRLCGASPHRAKFAATDKWLLVDGAVYCPACERTHVVQFVDRVAK